MGFLGKAHRVNKNCDKESIRKVLGRSFITLETLQTLVELVLNDQPLTYLSADIMDPEPLTPYYLLYG